MINQHWYYTMFLTLIFKFWANQDLSWKIWIWWQWQFYILNLYELTTNFDSKLYIIGFILLTKLNPWGKHPCTNNFWAICNKIRICKFQGRKHYLRELWHGHRYHNISQSSEKLDKLRSKIQHHFFFLLNTPHNVRLRFSCQCSKLI